MRLAIAVVAALLITGCATVLSSHRDGGSIRHSEAASDERIQAMADEECARFDKTARLTDTSYEILTGPLTRYRCVE